MKQGRAAIVAVCLALASVAPVVAQDEDLDRLLELRQATLEELTDVHLRLAEVEARRGSPDWIIVPVDDRTFAQTSLARLDELVPWVRYWLAEDEEGKGQELFLKALFRHDPMAAGVVIMASQGQLENVDTSLVRQTLRSILANPDVRARLGMDAHYDALEADLEEQSKALSDLLQVFDAAIEAHGGAVAPEPDPESGDDPCDSDGENAIDVLCSDWGDQPTPDPDADASWLPSIPPTEVEELRSPVPDPCPETDMWCQGSTASGDQGDAGFVCSGAFRDALEAPYTSLSPAQIGACFDDCQSWISWHADFGDTLPESCEEAQSPPSPDGSGDPLAELVDAPSLWDGCWDTPWGQLRLDQDAGLHVSGVLAWVDSAGERRQARLELDPLIEGYSDRLVGTMVDGPPTTAVACLDAAGGSVHWAGGRIDYAVSGRSFGGSFLPCLDDDRFERVPFTGEWTSTLDACVAGAGASDE